MVTTVIAVLIAVAAALVIAIPVTSRVAVDRRAREDQAKIGSAEEKARQIIDDALKSAETRSRMNQREKPKTAGQRLRVLKSVSCRRKKLRTRSWRLWNAERQVQHKRMRN